MHIIAKDIEFDAGHRVPNHESKCRNPHGHRYKIRVALQGQLDQTPGASTEGMLMDFGTIKDVMMEKIHDVLDHGFIVYRDDKVMKRMFWKDAVPERCPPEEDFKVVLFPYIPTAENLALWCFEQVRDALTFDNFEIESVTVWETPTSVATYYAEQ
jgi:6-pyruvoyltetrahydropterin/6-carboxytetrahydropterin synthase